MKNVLVMLTHPNGEREPLAVGVPGDRELDLRRLQAQVAPAEAAPFGEEDFAAHPQLVKGYIGPGVLGRVAGGRYLVDPRVADGSVWVTGADAAGRHVVGLVAGRDFRPDGVIDAADVHAGDPCPECGSASSCDVGSRSGTSSSSGRSTPRRSGWRSSGQMAATWSPRWAPTGSACPCGRRDSGKHARRPRPLLATRGGTR